MRQGKAVLVGLALLVVAGAIVFVVISQRTDEDDTAGTDPATDTSVSAEATPESDVEWVAAAGVELPISRTHGPRNTTDGLAKGFSQTEAGAALAAIHLLIRTGPTGGPSVFEPTITEQVTGANAAPLKTQVAAQYEQLRTTQGIEPGEPLAGADADVVGYLVGAYNDDPADATVDVLLTSPGLAATERYLQVTVSLQWLNGDWRVVAPPTGDWATVSTPLGAEPAGLLAYEDIG